MEAIADAVHLLSDGKIFMQRYDTGGDTYAWTVSDHRLTVAEQRKLYES